jgi:putative oxidoreductase
MNMAADVPKKWRTITIWALRICLGIAFLAVGATKLTGTANTVEYFAAIGWGEWFRYFTGFLDVSGAALLFVPRWTCYGALMLAFSVGTAALISLTVLRGDPNWGGPQTVLVPLVSTLLALTLGWLTRPRRPVFDSTGRV